MKYCSECGAQLEIRTLEGRDREVCPACGRVHYRQLKVGAAAVIEQDGKLLLLQRTHKPFAGCWNLPAGYAEADESPDQTAVREVFEEVGLRVEAEALLGLYFFQDDPRGNGIAAVYRCRVTGGEHITSDEAGAFRYFAPDELPDNLAGGGHDQAVRAWRDGAGAQSSAE
jgi:ADP-ribose pyrophosphatase YjhB (NUDIX family)